MRILKEVLLKELKETINRILTGLCELSQEEMENMIKLFGHLPMSKAQAYEFLDISRSQFDTLVKNGNLPKGQKRVGFKELVWYKDELENFKKDE